MIAQSAFLCSFFPATGSLSKSFFGGVFALPLSSGFGMILAFASCDGAGVEVGVGLTDPGSLLSMD